MHRYSQEPGELYVCCTASIVVPTNAIPVTTGGGCVVANPFAAYNASAPTGRDCTAIEGADTVECVDGGCAVKSCLSGWAVNEAGDGCAASETLKVQHISKKRIL